MRPIEFVPETILIKDVLNILTRKHKSVAVVLDEYGGTSGVMTVEDIVEELFGEIEDEHDTIELKESKINNKQFIFSARLDVDYLNEMYKLNLPENENYETLGGMIVSFTEEIPQQNEIIEIQGYEKVTLIYDIKGNLITKFEVRKQINDFDFNPTTNEIYLGCYDEFQVWSLITREKLNSLPFSGLMCIQFNHDYS